MVGKTYLERGKSVVVLTRWGKGGGPRNSLIQREDGTRVIRPFRGLRKADWNVTDDYVSMKKESVMDHGKIEERSLALHREIAKKTQQDPSLLLELRRRLEQAVGSERYSESVKDALREWFNILD